VPETPPPRPSPRPHAGSPQPSGGRTRAIDDRIELPALPESVARARAFVRDVLRRGRFTGDLRAVQLLASELVSNAIIHVGAPFEMVVDSSGGSVRVDVIDARGEGFPRLQKPDPHEIGGRGLQMVDRVATRWGVVEGPEDRRTVWFSFEDTGT
jgi:anti-sigma regulatory factor (Ser/Thr protein kinase)